MSHVTSTPTAESGDAALKTADLQQTRDALFRVLARYSDPAAKLAALPAEPVPIPFVDTDGKVKTDARFAVSLQAFAAGARRLWPRGGGVPESMLPGLVREELRGRGLSPEVNNPTSFRYTLGDLLGDAERQRDVLRVTGEEAEYEDSNGRLVRGKPAWRLPPAKTPPVNAVEVAEPADAKRRDEPAADSEPPDRCALAPSRVKAAAVYEWAVATIPGADRMPIRDVFAAILEKLNTTIEAAPPGAGEVEKLEGLRNSLPTNAETFGRYLRDAGIKRYNAKGERIQRISNFPRRDHL